MSRNVRYLAIDPGSKNLGWAQMIDDRILLTGNLKLWGDDPRTRLTVYRFAQQQMGIGVRLDAGFISPPQYLVLERYFPHRKYGATMIPELIGIIKLAADQMGTISIVEVPPQVVKKHITGNGRASKDDVRRAVNELYCLNVKSTDVSDAIAIGLAGLVRILEEIDNDL